MVYQEYWNALTFMVVGREMSGGILLMLFAYLTDGISILLRIQ